MSKITLAKGLNMGLRKAMEDDPKVLIMGEDVGKLGGVFRITDGLQKDFGEDRVIDSPLAESGIVGTAVGLALRGYRPVVEIQFDARSPRSGASPRPTSRSSGSGSATGSGSTRGSSPWRSASPSRRFRCRRSSRTPYAMPVAPRAGGGTVLVEAALRGGSLHVSVRDYGPGATREAVRAGEGLGLRLVEQRLQVRHCPEASLRIDTAEGAGFAVSPSKSLRARPGRGANRSGHANPRSRSRRRTARAPGPARVVGEVDWLELVGEAADGLSAVDAIDALKPDLVFLDVKLPEMSGLEVLARIRHAPAVIFTTAFDEFAVPAFEHEALDYLVKPFGRRRFLAAVERLRRRLEEERPRGAAGPVRRLFARDGDRFVPIPVASVSRIEAQDDYAAVHTAGRTYLLHTSLAELEARLYRERFLRVHRSHIVNLDHVDVIRPFDERRLLVVLKDGTTVVASRAGSQALRGLVE